MNNRDIRYLVVAENRAEANKRIKNIDCKMDDNEAAVIQLSPFSQYVFKPSNHVEPLVCP